MVNDLFELGKRYLSENKLFFGVQCMNDIIQAFPCAEPLYELCVFYKKRGQYKKAHIYLLQSRFHKKPEGDYGFKNDDVYTHLLDYEEFMLYRHVHPNSLPSHLIRKLLQKETPDKMKNDIHNNLAYYTKTIFYGNRTQFQGTPPPTFYFSTPSETSTIKLARMNNYFIEGNNTYIWEDSQHIQCKIIKILDDENWIEMRRVTSLPIHTNRLVEGLEDIRLLKFGEETLFSAISEDMAESATQRRVVWGKVEDDHLHVLQVFKSPYNRQIEKNWAFFEHNHDILFVYRWSPLEIYKLTLEKIKETSYPFSTFWRGSTNGFFYNGLLWFIVHSCPIKKKKHYIHWICALDKGYDIVGYSNPFRFSESPIEFCTSFYIENDQIYLSYSCMDKTCEFMNCSFYDFLSDVYFMFGI
jgi:hypothetical protein